MTRNLSLLLLLYLLTSCSDADPIDLATVPVASNQVLQPWSEDINRWSWDGKTPELLLGASSYEAPFLEKEWKAELNYLKKTGGNYVRVNLPVSQNATGPIIHSTTGISPNQAYWSLLKEYLSFATEKGIAVEIQVWDFNLPARWDSSGWSSVIDFTEQPYLEGEHPFYRTIPGSIGHQEAFGEVKSIQEDFISTRQNCQRQRWHCSRPAHQHRPFQPKHSWRCRNRLSSPKAQWQRDERLGPGEHPWHSGGRAPPEVP